MSVVLSYCMLHSPSLSWNDETLSSLGSKRYQFFRSVQSIPQKLVGESGYYTTATESMPTIILFPINESRKLYFLAEAPNQRWLLTCYKEVNGNPAKIWQYRLERKDPHRCPSFKGTLAMFIEELGFELREANNYSCSDLTAQQPLSATFFLIPISEAVSWFVASDGAFSVKQSYDMDFLKHSGFLVNSIEQDSIRRLKNAK